MANSYYKGFAVIRGAAGSVTLAGRATALVNSTPSATVSDISPVQEHTDSLGVPRTLTRPYIRYQLELEIVPGSGGTIAVGSVDEACNLVKYGDTIVTSGFEISDFNWDSASKAIVVGQPSASVSTDGLATVRVTAQKTTDNTGTAIDFTAAWATL